VNDNLTFYLVAMCSDAAAQNSYMIGYIQLVRQRSFCSLSLFLHIRIYVYYNFNKLCSLHFIIYEIRGVLYKVLNYTFAFS